METYSLSVTQVIQTLGQHASVTACFGLTPFQFAYPPRPYDRIRVRMARPPQRYAANLRGAQPCQCPESAYRRQDPPLVIDIDG